MTGSWHSLSISKLKKVLKTSNRGLTSSQVKLRLEKYGANVLAKEKKTSWFKLFYHQFLNLLTLILLGAVVISFVLGDALEAIIILVIVFFSAFLGFIQEFRSQKAMSALKKLASFNAHVLRNGRVEKILASDLVPGDLIVLKMGDKIPADARLIDYLNFEVSESVLTGESLPVKKSTDLIKDKNIPLAERKNMVYSGTVVTRGHAKAIVVATAMLTEFGKIADLLSQVETEKTPLEKKLTQIGRYLGIGSLLICALASLLGVLRGYPALEMLIWGVSLAVAAVPEALPAVVTGSLSLGVWEMAKKKAIVRRLPAVETLGSVSVICSDKTGTLTRNEMTVRQIFTNDQTIFVEGVGYQPNGGFLLKDKDFNFQHDQEFKKLVQVSLLCNDALLVKKAKDYLIDGDPTEGALVVLAAKAGLAQEKWQKDYPRLGEIPFDMNRKRMSTLHSFKSSFQLLVKGAPESVLAKCTYIQKNGKLIKLSKTETKKILSQTNQMANNALRVLAFAYKDLKADQVKIGNKDLDQNMLESDLVFVGLAGMIDPPRDEAAEAIKVCRRAGIKPIIITGDHVLTTWAVGRDLGLFTDKNQIIDSYQLNKLSYSKLLKIVDQKSYARVSPEDKLKIVKALKAKGYLVAMTGDGVNDAPALKQADIGVAMGIVGTDVAKEASDLILADDNFATIVVAIKKGREIYDNIKKYLFYLLRSNIGEVLVLGGGFLLNLPPILTAIQILWINLVTDGLPALALGVDPPGKQVMLVKPQDPSQSIFSKKAVSLMFILSLTMAVVLLPQFSLLLKAKSLVKAQTIVFITMVLMEMINAYNSRTDGSLFKINIFANQWLNLAVLSSIVSTALIIQIPAISRIFGTTVLSLTDWLMAIVLSLSVFLVSEMAKVALSKVSY